MNNTMKKILLFWLLVVTINGQSIEFAGRMGPADRKAIAECEWDLERQQAWDDKTLIPLSDIGILHERYHHEMYDSIDSDEAKWNRLDNFSMYFSDFPNYRGPEENFTDCHDLCPSESYLIGGVITPEVLNDEQGREMKRTDTLCLVVYPDEQNIRYRKCLTSLAANVPVTSDFQSKYACVPDGFIRRRIIVYCPEGAMAQCREVIITLPMACTPKLARCKYTHQGGLKKLMEMKKSQSSTFQSRWNSRIRGTGSSGANRRRTPERRGMEERRRPQEKIRPPPLA